MMKKFIVLVSLILCTTGCYSYTELSDLSIVNTLGIDYVDGQYQLIINVIDGEMDDGSLEEKYTTYSSQEDSLDEAFHNIYLKSNKRLYLSHIDLLVLTEGAINNKFREIINNFLENNEYRNNFNVVSLGSSNLEEFMNEQVKAEYINNLLTTNEKETGISKSKDFETIMKELLIDSNTYLPSILYSDEVSLDGFTLIRNYKVYGTLSLKDSVLLNLLNNDIHKTYLNGTNIYDNETIVTTKENQVSFRFVVILMNDNNFENLTEKDLLDFLNKYQMVNYDILKLTEKIRKKDYFYYKNTENLFSKLEFKVEFDVKKKENYLQGDEFNETR